MNVQLMITRVQNAVLNNPKTTLPAVGLGVVQIAAAFGYVIPGIGQITALAVVLIGLFSRDGGTGSDA